MERKIIYKENSEEYKAIKLLEQKTKNCSLDGDDLHYALILYNLIINLSNENDKYRTKQKEFIKYLEDEIDICDSFLDTVKSDSQEIPYGVISAGKTYITTRIKENETGHKVYKEVLKKYKEIIGVSDEKKRI